MAVTIWRELRVDRIAMTMVIVSEDLYKHVYGQLYGLQDEQAQVLPQGKIIVRNEKYSTRLDYYAAYTYKKAGRRKVADITVGANKLPGKLGLHRYLTLTLHPSQFHIGDFENFKWAFDTLFGDLTYTMMFHTSKVNYLELAIDSLSQKHHSFLLQQNYMKASSIWEEHNGHLGSTCVGSLSSNRYFRVYDKHKQLLDTGKPTVTKVLPHTRIEYVARRLGVTSADLINMKNPFLKLAIVDLADAIGVSTDKDWQDFIAESMTIGVPQALTNHPAKRKKYRGMLKKVAAKWWKPEQVWHGLAKALAVIAP